MTVILTSGGDATISTLAEFNDVITQAAFLAADSGTYEIHLAAGSTIDLRGGDGLLAFNLQGGVQVIVKGNGATLDGHTTTHGLIVYGGSVTFEDLTVANTTAQGGDGIGSAGAGAGLGGGLFVANDSGVPGNVTLSNVDFVNTKAAGGLTAFVRLGDFDSNRRWRRIVRRHRRLPGRL